MEIRWARPEDQEACQSLWHAAGWTRPGNERQTECFAHIFAAGRTLVATHDGRPEVMALTIPTDCSWRATPLAGTVIGSVNASRIARKRGLAGRLTALQLGHAHAAGAAVAFLGMFEQGYYDRFGFGTGSLSHFTRFDPADLRECGTPRIPIQFGQERAEELHAARLARMAWHGQLLPADARVTQAQLLEHPEPGFGLGYTDGPADTLSHAVWINPQEEEFGPWDITLMIYQNPTQARELLALLRTFGDQIHLMRILEPPHFQWQELLTQPFSRMRRSKGGTMESGIRAIAWWQVRILDVATCLGAVQMEGPPVRFNLTLTDPVTAFLEPDDPWGGSAGDYTVTLGPASCATPGHTSGLPLMTGSINAFSRWWWGVRPLEGLAISDSLRTDPALMAELDRRYLLPSPHPDWDF